MDRVVTQGCEYSLRTGPFENLNEFPIKGRVIFLDRDNTLVKDPGYLHRKDELELLPGVEAALRRMSSAGWPLFILTNQGGVAKDRFTLADSLVFNMELVKIVQSFGAVVNEIQFCPHHPHGLVAEFRKECDSRKPRPGMLLSIMAKWSIDASRVTMIGDQDCDIQAASAAGVSGMLAPPGRLGEAVDRLMDLGH